MSQFQESATLTAALLANKGAAAPSGAVSTFLGDLPRTPPKPQPRAEPAVRLASDSGVKSSPPPISGQRVKLSLRLDRKQHLRLKLASAHLGMSSQAILLTAMDAYLSRMAPEIAAGDCACLNSKER